MAKTVKEIATINLSGNEKGVISVARIDEPYGDGSAPVVSIGIFLKETSIDMNWKTHIPLGNIDELINALNQAKN